MTDYDFAISIGSECFTNSPFIKKIMVLKIMI